MGFLVNIKYYFEQNWGISQLILEKLIYTFIAIFLLWSIRFIIIRIVRRKSSDILTKYQWRKSTFYIVLLVGTLMIGKIWFKGFSSFSTYFGLLSAGIAISLKELFTSIAGWVFIMVKKPITIGDRIQISDFSGDVIDIRLFKFTLMEIGNWVDAEQSTGRIIHVPNSLILTETLANYSKGFQYIWDEIPVLLTFESDWKKGKKILLEIAVKHTEHLSKSAEKRVRKASKKLMIFYNKLTPVVYTSVKDSGVLLTIRYLCPPKKRRGQQEIIWEDILNAFSKEKNIDFAYPTQRFFDNKKEGK